MKILLDANALINLRIISCSDILLKVAQSRGWQLIIPLRAYSEATTKNPLDTILMGHLNKGLISVIHSSPSTFNRFKNTHVSLGDGELDAISIAHESGTPNQFALFTDDNTARKKAQQLGIKSFGIVALVASGNRQGLLSKKKSMDYVNTLKKNRFALKSNLYNAFVSSLI